MHPTFVTMPVMAINRIKAQLQNLRKLTGGGVALVGFFILSTCVYFSLASWTTVILGLTLLIGGLLIASSRTVYKIIIQLLGGVTK